MKKLIKIEGMTCGHCSARVEKMLSAIDGVTEAVVDLNAKSAIISLTTNVDESVIVEAVDDAGYEVTGIIDN